MQSMVEGAPDKTFNRARALRRQMSLAEVLLWRALRSGGFPAAYVSAGSTQSVLYSRFLLSCGSAGG